MPQIIFRLQKNLEVARQIFFAEKCRGLCQTGPLLRCGGDQIGIRAADARNQQVPHVPNGFAAEVLEVPPLFLERVHQAQGALGRLPGDGFDKFIQGILGHHAQEIAHRLVVNVVTAIRACLLQQR